MEPGDPGTGLWTWRWQSRIQCWIRPPVQLPTRCWSHPPSGTALSPDTAWGALTSVCVPPGLGWVTNEIRGKEATKRCANFGGEKKHAP